MIQLRAELLVPDALGVIVIDDGDGISPHFGSEGLRLGLALISSLTTGLEIERHEPHGTTVRMRFSLWPDECRRPSVEAGRSGWRLRAVYATSTGRS
jgi:hypothetical protein